MSVNLQPADGRLRELTAAEIDHVAGGSDVGFYTTGNSVGFNLPGLLHLSVSTDGEKLYLTGTAQGHGGSLVLTPPGGKPA